jgi:hypothetical protein
MDWSLTQVIIPPVKNDYVTELEAWALNGLEEELEKKLCKYVEIIKYYSKVKVKLSPYRPLGL